MLDAACINLYKHRSNVLEDTKYLVDAYRTALFFVQGVLCSGNYGDYMKQYTHAHYLTHSFTYLPIHSHIHLPTHLLIHSLTYHLTHLPSHSPTYHWLRSSTRYWNLDYWNVKSMSMSHSLWYSKQFVSVKQVRQCSTVKWYRFRPAPRCCPPCPPPRPPPRPPRDPPHRGANSLGNPSRRWSSRRDSRAVTWRTPSTSWIRCGASRRNERNSYILLWYYLQDISLALI